MSVRLQEKLLANLDEDQQNDAAFTGGDEVFRPTFSRH